MFRCRDQSALQGSLDVSKLLMVWGGEGPTKINVQYYEKITESAQNVETNKTERDAKIVPTVWESSENVRSIKLNVRLNRFYYTTTTIFRVYFVRYTTDSPTMSILEFGRDCRSGCFVRWRPVHNPRDECRPLRPELGKRVFFFLNTSSPNYDFNGPLR